VFDAGVAVGGCSQICVLVCFLRMLQAGNILMDKDGVVGQVQTC
jgi:hypothetical protein